VYFQIKINQISSNAYLILYCRVMEYTTASLQYFTFSIIGKNKPNNASKLKLLLMDYNRMEGKKAALKRRTKFAQQTIFCGRSNKGIWCFHRRLQQNHFSIISLSCISSQCIMK
jgi:hypothetical protein